MNSSIQSCVAVHHRRQQSRQAPLHGLPETDVVSLPNWRSKGPRLINDAGNARRTTTSRHTTTKCFSITVLTPNQIQCFIRYLHQRLRKRPDVRQLHHRQHCHLRRLLRKSLPYIHNCSITTINGTFTNISTTVRSHESMFPSPSSFDIFISTTTTTKKSKTLTKPSYRSLAKSPAWAPTT